MAYYFAVETEENSYVAKKIRNSRLFGSEYQTTEPYACTLEEIDRFTTEFKNEGALKRHLLSEEIIPYEDIDKEIAIIFSEGIKNRPVGGNILYIDSKLMFDNPSKIISYISNTANKKDYTFFKELSKKLPEGTINKSAVLQLAYLIELSTKDNKDLDQNMIEEVAKMLIYHTSTKDNGSIVCTDKINAENLHNVLSFISEYEKSLSKTVNKTKTLKNTSN